MSLVGNFQRGCTSPVKQTQHFFLVNGGGDTREIDEFARTTRTDRDLRTALCQSLRSSGPNKYVPI